MVATQERARQAEDSAPVEHLARAGLVSRGVIWTVVGLLALRVALGDGGQADRKGALSALRDQPFGQVLLVLVAIGFLGHALWRVLQAVAGHRDEHDDNKRLGKRAVSAYRALVYGALGVSTLAFLLSGGGSDGAKGPTAKVMALPGGVWLVGLGGAGVVVAGLVMVVKGLKQDFTDKLKPVPAKRRRFVHVVGTTGLVGRGLVYVLVGSFLVEAAWTYDPNKAKGLDEALKTLAQQAYGDALLLLAVVGMLAFGAWSFAEARYRDL